MRLGCKILLLSGLEVRDAMHFDYKIFFSRGSWAARLSVLSGIFGLYVFDEGLYPFLFDLDSPSPSSSSSAPQLSGWISWWYVERWWYVDIRLETGKKSHTMYLDRLDSIPSGQYHWNRYQLITRTKGYLSFGGYQISLTLSDYTSYCWPSMLRRTFNEDRNMSDTSHFKALNLPRLE